MLYTVRPLERVYAMPSAFDQKNSDPKAMNAQEEYSEVLLPNGRIVTRRDGENYIIERLNSTNMKDYLNDEYVPGKSIKQ
jgi:hypothetical protein